MLIEVIVLGLVSYRVWRLLAYDAFTENLRLKTIDRIDSDWIKEGWYCPWCLGSWLTILIGLATHFTGLTSTSPWLLIPAAAVVTGALHRVSE